jgi:hypothetical protein
MTVFFGVVCLMRPQWVLIFKVVNEVLEELGMPLVRRFAWTVSVLNLEPRYDTLINDLALAVVPFSALALHLATVIEITDPIPHSPKINYVYVLQLLRVFLQFQLFVQGNQSHICFGNQTWTIGDYVFKVGNLAVCVLQVGLLWLLVFFERLSLSQACVIAAATSLIWAPFVVYRVHAAGALVDEQIVAILSFAIAGLAVCGYQMYTKNRLLLFWTALPCYLLALVVYWNFEAVIAAPIDRFYYHSQWCGLSDMSGSSASWFHCVSEDT